MQPNDFSVYFCCLLLLPGVQLTIEIQASCTSKTLKDFKIKLEEDAEGRKKLAALQAEVQEFARSFPMPGYDDV